MPATYESIATTTLTGTQTDVTFSSISGSFTDLILVTNVRALGSFYILRVNSDSGSNYSRTRLLGNGTSASSSRSSNITEMIIDNSDSTNWTMATIHFMNYANTTTNKTVLSRGNGAAYDANAQVHLWRSTAAINSINLIQSSGFTTGSTFTLYGIKAA